MELSALSAIPLSASVYVGSDTGSKIDLTYKSDADLSTNLSCITIKNRTLLDVVSVLVDQIAYLNAEYNGHITKDMFNTQIWKLIKGESLS